MSRELGIKYTIEGRYFNAQGWAVAIVASVTHGIDWGAYIGAKGRDHGRGAQHPAGIKTLSGEEDEKEGQALGTGPPQ